MREILFCGKRVDNGEWIYGDLRHWPSGNVGIHSEELHHTYYVDPESVGQFTGQHDKNGTRIFEWNIVKDNNGRIGYIVFLPQDAGWAIVWKDCDSRMGHRSRGSHYDADPTLEVIGNVYDNVELLKEGE